MGPIHASIESVCETLTNGIGPFSSCHRRHGQTLYKGVTDDPELLSFSFSTCGNSACCGIDLTIGEEYLIGLYGEGADLVAESCGLFREWESVTDAELAELEGCSEESDICDGSCGEFEVCVRVYLSVLILLTIVLVFVMCWFRSSLGVVARNTHPNSVVLFQNQNPRLAVRATRLPPTSSPASQPLSHSVLSSPPPPSKDVSMSAPTFRACRPCFSPRH